MIEKKEKPFNIQYVQMDEIAKFHKEKANYIKTSSLSTCIALVIETKNKDLLLGHMSSQNVIFDKNACEKYFQDLNKDNIEKIKIIYSNNVSCPYINIVKQYFQELNIPVEMIPFDNSIKDKKFRFSVIIDQDNNLYIIQELNIPVEMIPFDNSIKDKKFRFSVIIDQDNNLYIIQELNIPVEMIPFDNSIKDKKFRFSVIIDQDNNLYIKNSKKEHDKFFIEPDEVYQNNKTEINEYKKVGYNWRRNVDLFRNKEYRESLKKLHQNKLANKITVHNNCFMREKTDKFTKCNSNPELLGLDKYKNRIKEHKL